MFRFLLLAAFVPALALAQIPYDLCDEGYPAPDSFNIPECTSLPCGLAVGDTITLQIGVNVPGAVSSMPVSANICAGGTCMPFPLPSGDACNAIAGGCPQEAGVVVVAFSTPIQGVTAGVEYTIQVEIGADSASNVIACGKITTTFD